MAFDLDPGAPDRARRVRPVALQLRDLLGRSASSAS